MFVEDCWGQPRVQSKTLKLKQDEGVKEEREPQRGKREETGEKGSGLPEKMTPRRARNPDRPPFSLSLNYPTYQEHKYTQKFGQALSDQEVSDLEVSPDFTQSMSHFGDSCLCSLLPCLLNHTAAAYTHSHRIMTCQRKR